MYDTLASQNIDELSSASVDYFLHLEPLDFAARGQAGRSPIKGFIAKLKAAGFALTAHAGERIAQRLQGKGIRLNAKEFARAFLNAKHYRQRGRNTRIALVGRDIAVAYILTGRAGRIAGRRPLLVTVYPSLSAGGRLPLGLTPISRRALNFRLDVFDQFDAIADAYDDDDRFWDTNENLDPLFLWQDDNIDEGKRKRSPIPTHWDNLKPGQQQHIQALCRAKAKRTGHKKKGSSTGNKHQAADARRTRDCVNGAKRHINSGKTYSELISQLER